jgi:hypothetical protein
VRAGLGNRTVLLGVAPEAPAAPISAPSTSNRTPPPKTTRRSVFTMPCSTGGSSWIMFHHSWVGTPPNAATVYALSCAICADNSGAPSIRPNATR